MRTYAVDLGFSYGHGTAPLAVKEIHVTKGTFTRGPLIVCPSVTKKMNSDCF